MYTVYTLTLTRQTESTLYSCLIHVSNIRLLGTRKHTFRLATRVVKNIYTMSIRVSHNTLQVYYYGVKMLFAHSNNNNNEVDT